MPYIYILGFVALVVLSFASSPPTFLILWFMSKFVTHPKLSPTMNIVANDSALRGDEKHEFVVSWNDADLLEDHTRMQREHIDEEEPSPAPVTLEVRTRRYAMSFYISVHGDEIQIQKKLPNNPPVNYIVEGQRLHDWIVGRARLIV